MTALRANFWKIYAYKFSAEFFLLVPVLILYYVAHGLNATQIFSIQATFHLAMLVLEVPSGYMADVIGRKKTLVLGAVFFPLGIATYAFTGSFATFVLAEFLVAVANSMRSGCESAFIYDTLVDLGEEGEYKKFEGRAFFFTRMGTATAAVFGGLLALVSLHLPFYLNVVTCSLMLPAALALTEPARHKLVAESPVRDILRISRKCFTHPLLRLYILLFALIGTCSIIGVWAYFLYYERLRIPVVWFGLIFAGFQLASAFGASRAHWIAGRVGERTCLRSSLLIGAVFLALGVLSSPLLVAAILLAAFLWGVSTPVLLDAMNTRIPSETRATMLSVAGMVINLSFVVLSPIFGNLVDAFSLSTAFLALGGLFLVLGTVLLVALSRSQERKRV